MKAIYKNIAWAALALGAVACSQEDDFSPSYLSDSDAVRITAQVGTNDVTGGFTRSNPLGTADEQKTFNLGDQISVAAGTQSPVVYQLGDDGWTPAGESYLKWETNEMNITAWYPAGKNNASATTFTVPTEYADLADLADADYMVYSGTQTKGDDKAVNLTMERKMVRIVVNEISYNDQFATGYSVTGIKVHSNTKGYILYDEYDEGLPEAGYITVSALQQGDDFYALLAPTSEDPTSTFLTVTVTNNTNPEDVHTLTVEGIPATIVGYSYNYSLTVGKDYAGIGGVTVTDWTGAIIDGGEAEEVKVETTIEGTTATVHIPELATDAMVEKAMQELDTDGLTDMIVIGDLDEERQGYLATALTGKTLNLYLTHLESSTQIAALQGITAHYGYYVQDGTYFVYNANGLQAWNSDARTNLSTNLKLESDITLSSDSTWTPVGTEESPYTGTIEGGGHTIYDMTIETAYNVHAGMLGYATGCSIKNLYLVNVNVTSNNGYTGAFVGRLKDGTIENCGVESGSVKQTSDDNGYFAGGIVGILYNGKIIACYNAASVDNIFSSGGIVGYVNGQSYIIGCYNAGAVNVTRDSYTTVGGIMGIYLDRSGNEFYIKGCYNTASVTSVQSEVQIPGAIGGMYSAEYIKESKCNYYSSNHSYGFGQTKGYTSSNEGCTRISNTASAWETAAVEMNKELETYGYKYVPNTNASTKSTQPLVIVKVE